MHAALLPLLLLSHGSQEAPRRNHAPIVLIGGFTTWGREELLGFKYWGGKGRDIQEDLREHGYETVTAPVGPLSSNWDRACEVFAVLKGGRVDYGKIHAMRHGHARYGRTFPGLLGTWGETESNRKVHLLTHSQGGQTARVLTHLLVEGDTAERTGTPPQELSPLFQGGHSWILSVTTLSTPHDGTSLVFRREGLIAPARKMFTIIANLQGNKGQSIYDLKLDQWGIQRGEKESLPAYADRIFASQLWRGTMDFAAWDLSPTGAAQLNERVKADPNVFYFSWSTAKTRKDREGHHVPAPHMTLLWREGARFMGRPIPGQASLDSSWWRNDGVVNTRSMAGPSTDAIQPFDGTPKKGAWNHMGALEGWDHSEIIGIGPEHGDEVLAFYRRWAAFLGGLEE